MQKRVSGNDVRTAIVSISGAYTKELKTQNGNSKIITKQRN